MNIWILQNKSTGMKCWSTFCVNYFLRYYLMMRHQPIVKRVNGTHEWAHRPYQLLITAACTNTGGKMKDSLHRAADRCPFVLWHSLSQVTSFMQLGILCDKTEQTMNRVYFLGYMANDFWSSVHSFEFDRSFLNLILLWVASCNYTQSCYIALDYRFNFILTKNWENMLITSTGHRLV